MQHKGLFVEGVKLNKHPEPEIFLEPGSLIKNQDLGNVQAV